MMEEGTEEEKQKLMDKEQIPESKKLAKRDGTRYKQLIHKLCIYDER